MYSGKIFLEILKGISQNKSLCRVLQNFEAKKHSISGNIIEFGAEPKSTKNFSSLMHNKTVKNFYFSDKYLSKKGIIKADLNKKINIKKKFFDNVILFNVLEHIFDVKNAKNQISKITKKNGYLIGSTPFLYRFHKAPSDYLRFTKPFIIRLFKKEYKIKNVKNLGFGPFCLCYSMLSDFTKKIPILNYILFIISFLLDLFLDMLVKYDLKDIYPIAIFFKLKKK